MAKVLPRQAIREVKAARAKERDIFPMEGQPIAVPLLVMTLRNPLLMVVRAARFLRTNPWGVLVTVVSDVVALVVVVDTLVVVVIPLDMVVEAFKGCGTNQARRRRMEQRWKVVIEGALGSAESMAVANDNSYADITFSGAYSANNGSGH